VPSPVKRPLIHNWRSSWGRLTALDRHNEVHVSETVNESLRGLKLRRVPEREETLHRRIALDDEHASLVRPLTVQHSCDRFQGRTI